MLRVVGQRLAANIVSFSNTPTRALRAHSAVRVSCLKKNIGSQLIRALTEPAYIKPSNNMLNFSYIEAALKESDPAHLESIQHLLAADKTVARAPFKFIASTNTKDFELCVKIKAAVARFTSRTACVPGSNADKQLTSNALQATWKEAQLDENLKYYPVLKKAFVENIDKLYDIYGTAIVKLLLRAVAKADDRSSYTAILQFCARKIKTESSAMQSALLSVVLDAGHLSFLCKSGDMDGLDVLLRLVKEFAHNAVVVEKYDTAFLKQLEYAVSSGHESFVKSVLDTLTPEKLETVARQLQWELHHTDVIYYY